MRNQWPQKWTLIQKNQKLTRVATVPLTPSGVRLSAPQTVMALCGMEVAST